MTNNKLKLDPIRICKCLLYVAGYCLLFGLMIYIVKAPLFTSDAKHMYITILVVGIGVLTVYGAIDKVKS